MAKHLVKCKICGQQFDLNAIQGVRWGKNRYAHQTCYPEGELVPMEVPDVDPALAELKDFIKELFGAGADWPNIIKQIQKYTGDEYKYTYSGIKKSLAYFYIIKKNDVAKANGHIGIVPYVYKQAFDYYYSLWLANQKNENVNVNSFIPKEKVVHITNPERRIKKRRLFTFLDEEEE